MKKFVGSCLAMSLLFAAGVFQQEAGAQPPHKDVKVSGPKQTGLENALNRGNKSDAAIQAIQNNILKKSGQLEQKPVPVDVTLSSFTIGGVNVSGLAGINTSAGATLKVSSFTDFKGIVAVAKDSKSTVTVSVNAVQVPASSLSTYVLRTGDKVVVTVKNGDRTQQYTVNLVHADEIGLATFTIGGVNVNGLTGLTTGQGAFLKVNQSGLKGLSIQTKDQEASVTVKVNGTQIQSSQLANYWLYAQDVVLVTVKDGNTTQEYKVTLVQAEDLTLDRFRINGTDIRNVSGLTTTDGAILEVQDFSYFNGLEVSAQDSGAVVTVKINDIVYTPSQYSGFTFRSGDRVVVEVKKGSLVETYKVKLVREQDYLLKKLTIGGQELRTWAGLTTSNGAIVKVEDFAAFKGVVAEAKDRDADVEVKLNGYLVTSGLSTLALRANDVIVVTIDEGDVTQTFKVTVQ